MYSNVGTSEVCEQSCQTGTDGSVTSLQTAPQTAIPEFHLSHRVLKTACFQWSFRLIHSMREMSLLSSHLHTVSSLCTCSLDVDYIAWHVAVSSEVDGFQPSAKGPKPFKINIAQIVVTNLNTSVTLDL